MALSVGVGRGAGFWETYRIGAYQPLPYVLSSFVPFVGIFLAVGAMSYGGVFSVQGAHDAGGRLRVVPLVLTFLLFVAALVAVFASLAGGAMR